MLIQSTSLRPLTPYALFKVIYIYPTLCYMNPYQ